MSSSPPSRDSIVHGGSTTTPPRHDLVIRVLIVAAFTVILNETIMGIAIPHLMTDLAITAVAAQWLTTAFLLTMAVVIPMTGFLLQRFPTRGVFFAAMTLFTIGTLLGAVAPGFEVLLMARVVQASGTAIMLPLLMTTVMELEPPATRGRRMGNISIVISVAPAIGPTISGLILQVLHWRFLYVFVLPVAIGVLILGARHMRSIGETRPARIDWLSVPLSAFGFGGIVLGLSLLGEGAAGEVATMVVPLAIGLVATVAFILRQRHLQRDDRALLDLRTFRTRNFSLAIAMFIASTLSLFGMIILLPLFTQGVLGMSVLASGLLLLPGGLVMGLLAPLVGRTYDRMGPRPLMVPGSILILAGMSGLAWVISTSTPWWQLVALHLLVSIGLALVFTPLFSASLGSLPRQLYSHGSATVSALQQVAAGAGTALFVAIMSAVSVSAAAGGASDAQAQANGIQAAIMIGAGVAIIAVILSTMVHKPVDLDVPELTPNVH